MSAPIAVCHLITSLDLGGAQRMLQKLLAGADRERFRMRVVSLRSGGVLADELRAAGVDVEELGLARGRIEPRGIAKLRASLAADPPDVLQTWLVHADLLGALVARRAGVPLMWNLRNAGQADASRARLRGVVERACAWLSRRPAAVIVNSEAGRAFHESRGYRPRRWELVPNGFPLPPERTPEDRARARRELELPADAVVALTLARDHPSKGVDVLAQAWARLAEVGDSDEASARLLGLVAGAGLGADCTAFPAAAADRVRLLGPRADTTPLFHAADLLVLPSRFEGFPNVIGEALAHGLPCVATDVGDVRRVLGEAGRVVSPEDPDALARAMRTLATLEPGERERLGALGRARVEREYSLERVVARYEELYRSLAREPAG